MPFRSGDVVQHVPSGEKWWLACAEHGYVHPCGWPESMAKESDCILLEAATDEESLAMVESWAKMPGDGKIDSRRNICHHQLMSRQEAFCYQI